MPTLYSTEGYRYKKPSVIEVLLYNMASILGGVAAGYDLRKSNVSPLHPRLQPYSADTEAETSSAPPYEGATYAHNTYHGPTRHLRPTLSAVTGPSITNIQPEEQKPIRFTDSPSHYGHHSGTSGRGTHYTPSTGNSDQLADLYHNYRENFQTSPAPDYYYRNDYSYDRTADYVVKHPYDGKQQVYSGYDECNFDYNSSEYRAPFPSHRRNNSSSSANPPTEEYSPSRHFPPKKREETYRTPTKQLEFSRKNSIEKDVERPGNLGLELGPTKLRSSLKKHNKKTDCSPTNPTPPDSLTSETDSSYVSARDASSGSHSRVRFSPETMDGFVPERRPSRHS